MVFQLNLVSFEFVSRQDGVFSCKRKVEHALGPVIAVITTPSNQQVSGEKSVVEEVVVSVIEVLVEGIDVFRNGFVLGVDVDVSAHQYTVEPVAEATDIICVVPGFVHTLFCEVLEGGVG